MGPVYLEMKSEDGKTTKKEGPYYIVPKDDSFEIFKDFKSAPKEGWYSDIKLRSMSFATPIVVYFYVGFLGALGLSLPVLFYLAAKFIAPGLTNQVDADQVVAPEGHVAAFDEAGGAQRPVEECQDRKSVV